MRRQKNAYFVRKLVSDQNKLKYLRESQIGFEIWIQIFFSSFMIVILWLKSDISAANRLVINCDFLNRIKTKYTIMYLGTEKLTNGW
jgi:hypothetical protein